MPSPIKYSSTTANSRTQPKKTLKTKAHKTQPKIGGSPKTPTKRVPLTVSKSSTLKKPKTKTHKTQPKKPYGHSRIFGGVHSLSMPSVNTYGPAKSTSAPVLSRSVQPFTSAPVNSTLQRLQQNGCLTLHKIDNELIIYLGTLDTSKIKKLIFDETKIQDEKTFKAFLFILKRFQNGFINQIFCRR